jgi:hypothetical protein
MHNVDSKQSIYYYYLYTYLIKCREKYREKCTYFSKAVGLRMESLSSGSDIYKLIDTFFIAVIENNKFGRKLSYIATIIEV